MVVRGCFLIVLLKGNWLLQGNHKKRARRKEEEEDGDDDGEDGRDGDGEGRAI